MNANKRSELLAEKLSTIRVQEPSENYLSKGFSDIRSQKPATAWPQFSRGLSWAVSVALTVSLGSNLMLSLDNKPALTTLTEPAEVAQISRPNQGPGVNPQLQLTDVAANDSVFRFLCLTSTTLLMDGLYELGELRGFGEWVFFEVPNNYKVNISLLPLRDWNAIGEFKDGRISLALEDGHQLSLLGAGVGPTSLKQGGPFPVYGSIERLNPDDSEFDLLMEEAEEKQGRLMEAAEEKQRRLLASRGDANVSQPSTTQVNPYLQVSNILSGIDTSLDLQTRKYFGAFIDDDVCG